MLAEKTWYTVHEAEAKFGVPAATLLQWVEEGVVRSEDEGREMRVNADDLELKVQELVKIS